MKLNALVIAVLAAIALPVSGQTAPADGTVRALHTKRVRLPRVTGCRS